MPRSTARLLAPLLAAGLIATLSACGGDKAKDPDPSSSTSATESAAAAPMKDGTVEGVTVKGEQGETPKITWAKEGVTATDPVRQVLTKGDGETVQKDDKVFVQLWVGNGTKKKEAYSSYTGAPQLVTASTTQTLAVLADAIIDQPVGSRLLVAQSVSGAFGESGQADIGLKPDDTAVLVIDITGKLLDGPKGAKQDPAAWAPKVEASGDIPTALDFSDTPKPSGDFEITTLIKGKGPKLQKGDHVYVNYLGQVYDGKEPFDQSYNRGTPFDFDLGGGSVIKGWDQGLVGVTVGSRVILQVPPDWGYGKKGNGSAGIAGTDTLYFVVDVLGAS